MLSVGPRQPVDLVLGKYWVKISHSVSLCPKWDAASKLGQLAGLPCPQHFPNPGKRLALFPVSEHSAGTTHGLRPQTLLHVFQQGALLSSPLHQEETEAGAGLLGCTQLTLEDLGTSA